MRTLAELQKGIADEITEEKGSSLARTGEKLEGALAALAVAETALAAAPGDAKLSATRAEWLLEAAEWLWFLIVQRDAIGPNSHEQIFQIYKVPGEVRRLMGPRLSR